MRSSTLATRILPPPIELDAYNISNFEAHDRKKRHHLYFPSVIPEVDTMEEEAQNGDLEVYRPPSTPTTETRCSNSNRDIIDCYADYWEDDQDDVVDPYRRRRSYSECAIPSPPPSAATSTQTFVSTSTRSIATNVSTWGASLKSTISLRLKHKSTEGPELCQKGSGLGRKKSLLGWVGQRSLSASALHGFGNPTESRVSRGKYGRQETRLSYGARNASSTADVASETTSSPGRSPRLERWQMALKRGPGLFRSPSTSVSLTSPTSLASSPSSSSSFSPSPSSVATRLRRTLSKRNHAPAVAPRIHGSGQQHCDDKEEITISPFKRNQSTPNLQIPKAGVEVVPPPPPPPDLSALSVEDRGKVSAFYAPPPPAHTVQALSPQRFHGRTTMTATNASGCKGSSLGGAAAAVPPAPRKSMTAGVRSPSSPHQQQHMGVPVPSAVPRSRDLAKAGEGAGSEIGPVTLPLVQSSLSEESNTGGGGGNGSGNWDSSDARFGETGAIYFTLDESCEVGNGEAMLTIVECDDY